MSTYDAIQKLNRAEEIASLNANWILVRRIRQLQDTIIYGKVEVKDGAHKEVI